MKRLLVFLLTFAPCIWAIDAAAQTTDKDNNGNITNTTSTPDKEPRIDGSRLGGRPPAARLGLGQSPLRGR